MFDIPHPLGPQVEARTKRDYQNTNFMSFSDEAAEQLIKFVQSLTKEQLHDFITLAREESWGRHIHKETFMKPERRNVPIYEAKDDVPRGPRINKIPEDLMLWAFQDEDVLDLYEIQSSMT